MHSIPGAVVVLLQKQWLRYLNSRAMIVHACTALFAEVEIKCLVVVGVTFCDIFCTSTNDTLTPLSGIPLATLVAHILLLKKMLYNPRTM